MVMGSPGRHIGVIGAILVAVLGLVLGASPLRAQATQAQQDGVPIRVVVTLPALASLVQPLLPAGSECVALMKPGRSEHHYEFTPADLVQLAKADMVVLVGVGLEPQVEEFLRKRPKAGRQEVSFGATVGVQYEEPNEEGQAHTHADGSTCTHAHGVDPHLWLDPKLVRQLVPALRAGVLRAQLEKGKREKVQVGSGERERLDSAQRDLLARVDAMHERYERELSPKKGQAIVTHHDAFGRIAERYGLVVAASIQSMHAGEATPERIAKAVEAVRTRGARAVFFEPQYDRAIAERIASSAGVRLEMLDPLGDGDWFAMMERNLESLVRGLGEAIEKTEDVKTDS